jgi:putative nucleotidyltransferase with HDIG domain
MRPAVSQKPAISPEQSVEYRLALAFGFMVFIPVVVIWAITKGLSREIGIAVIVGSAFVGFYGIVRPMLRSVLKIAERVRAVTAGHRAEAIEVKDQNEIGELARAFNKITFDLEHKIEELESSRQLVKKLLSRIGTAIVSYEGIDNLLTLIVENATAALEAQGGSLMLVDGQKQELYVKAAWSTSGPVALADLSKLRMKVGEGAVGLVAKDGQSLRTRGSAALLGLTNGRAAEEGMILSVPLRLRDTAIGVISVYREQAHKSFVDDDEMLLASIGSQMAVAIENYRLNMDVERTYLETVLTLALAVEAKDPYSAGHSKRVGYYAAKIAEKMGLDAEMQRILSDAGVLHDIGKIGIKDEILLKPSPLNEDEQKIMQQHPIIGEAIVKPVRSLQKVVGFIRHHHEWMDGSGYPGGLKGEQIPLGARILSVADVYDSLVTDRPYRKRIPIEEAKAELQRQAGSHLDPQAVDAFFKVLEDKELRRTTAPA